MKTKDLRGDFEKFDKENPEVWTLFVHYTLEMIKLGFQRYSADAVMHRVRWESDLKTASRDGLKINDHHVSFFARKFEAAYPQHAGFFRRRKSAADKPVYRTEKNGQGAIL